MRTLVIGPSWVGDLIISGPLIEALSHQGPVDVFLPEFLVPLAQRLPGVATAIPSPFGHGALQLAQRYAVARSFRGRYDAAYILPNSFKSALIPALAGIPRRVGFRGEMRFGLINELHPLDPKRLPRLVDRYGSLVSPPARSSPKLLSQDTRELRARLELPAAGKTLVLCPGAEYGPAKQWPLESYAEVGRLALGQGFQVWVMGGAKDRLAGKTLEYAVPGIRNLAGQTTLAEAADLIHEAQAVITNDSGLMHVAAAVNTPLIAIFGSSSPQYTPPLSDRATILSKQLPCSPCFKRECPLGHTECLTLISVDEVMSALARLDRLAQ